MSNDDFPVGKHCYLCPNPASYYMVDLNDLSAGTYVCIRHTKKEEEEDNGNKGEET